jgi:hypothetical protein
MTVAKLTPMNTTITPLELDRSSVPTRTDEVDAEVKTEPTAHPTYASLPPVDILNRGKMRSSDSILPKLSMHSPLPPPRVLSSGDYAPPPTTIEGEVAQLNGAIQRDDWESATSYVESLGNRLQSSTEPLTAQQQGDVRASIRNAAERAEKADKWSFIQVLLSVLALGIPFLVDALTTNDKERLAQTGRSMLDASQHALAEQLIQVRGTATADDVQPVLDELMKLPTTVLQRLTSESVKVIVCRDSVTDYLTDLRGVQPRGWPPGSTWDSVPGLYDGGHKEVVIATHAIDGGRGVPSTGDGHGSFNLVLHESLHAYDGVTGASADAAFSAARNSDSGALSAYEQQAADAGRQETFAETGARFYGGDAGLQGERPSLSRYYRDYVGTR